MIEKIPDWKDQLIDAFVHKVDVWMADKANKLQNLNAATMASVNRMDFSADRDAVELIEAATDAWQHQQWWW